MQRLKADQRLHFAKKPEIVVGLVGAVGTDLGLIKNVLKGELAKIGYRVHEIRLSCLLGELFGQPEPDQEDHNARTIRLMDCGDHLRRLTEQADVMALLAVAAIRRYREHTHRQSTSDSLEKLSDDLANIPIDGHAFVLHSLKIPDEVRLLREVYGASFFLIGGYARKDSRIKALTRKIAKSRPDPDRNGCREDAKRLIDRDERDKHKTDYGQNVQDTFPRADLFVNSEDAREMVMDIGRFIRCFFSYQFHTPTQAEYGMFHAVAAARRSADLSRQVGDAIASPDGDIIAVGCNEVPKSGGGMYWEGDQNDLRDFQLGYDSSQIIKREIVGQVHRALYAEPEDQQSFTEFEKKLKATTINDLLEFGRMVHAEMAALVEASRRGVSVKGATMYVTTFPCHMCARHIIAAGIERVVYIEPYPKSKVSELYKEQVRIDGTDGCKSAVYFNPFVGIAPRQYMTLFAIPWDVSRKDKSGFVIEWKANQDTWMPRFREFVASYIFIEVRVERYLSDLLQEKAGGIGEYKQGRWRDWQEAPNIMRIGEWLSSHRELMEQGLESLFPPWMKRIIFPQHREAKRGREKQKA